jgi:hypothetical protein
MERRWNETDREKPKCSEKNLSQCHFVYHKSLMDWPGIEPGPPRWEAGDLPPEPWHSNACAYSALSVCKILDGNRTTVFTHPPYPPAVAPCNFFLFPKLNIALKGMRFNDPTMTQEKSQDALAKIQTVCFTKCF